MANQLVELVSVVFGICMSWRSDGDRLIRKCFVAKKFGGGINKDSFSMRGV